MDTARRLAEASAAGLLRQPAGHGIDQRHIVWPEHALLPGDPAVWQQPVLGVPGRPRVRRLVRQRQARDEPGPRSTEPVGPGQVPASVAQIAVATVIAFGVGYATIAWLLRYVQDHTIYVFVWYRVLLGLLVLLAVTGGVVPAT